jgi:hypothetical protein
VFGGVHSDLNFAEAKSNRTEIYAEPAEVHKEKSAKSASSA